MALQQVEKVATAPVVECASCCLCGSDKATPLYPKMLDLDSYGQLPAPYSEMTFQHVKCDNCQTVYMQERVPQARISIFYSGEYHCFKPFSERGWLIRTASQFFAKRKAEAIRQLMPSESNLLLDYGCGSGTWLRELADLNTSWALIGTDVVEQAVTMAKAAGVDAHLAGEDDLATVLAGRKVGVFHLFHVIEHIPDPVYALKRLHAALVPGGHVIGQTPNIDSWDARLFGRYWTQWHVPRHLVLYTPDTLRRHAEAAGFEVVSIKGSLLSVANWAGSILKCLAIKRGRECHPTAGRAYALLMLAMAPVVLLQMLVSMPGNIDFVLRRKPA